MRKASKHNITQKLTIRQPLNELFDSSEVSRPNIVGKKIENGLVLDLEHNATSVNRILVCLLIARVVFVARPKSACAVSKKRKRVESRINVNKSRNEEKRLTQRELYGKEF